MIFSIATKLFHKTFFYKNFIKNLIFFNSQILDFIDFIIISYKKENHNSSFSSLLYLK